MRQRQTPSLSEDRDRSSRERTQSMKSKKREETPGFWLEQVEDRSWGGSGREGQMWGRRSELSLRYVECGMPVPHPSRDAGQQPGGRVCSSDTMSRFVSTKNPFNAIPVFSPCRQRLWFLPFSGVLAPLERLANAVWSLPTWKTVLIILPVISGSPVA